MPTLNTPAEHGGGEVRLGRADADHDAIRIELKTGTLDDLILEDEDLGLVGLERRGCHALKGDRRIRRPRPAGDLHSARPIRKDEEIEREDLLAEGDFPRIAMEVDLVLR